MRNLKRALSVALAAVMLLGMMVIGAGAMSINDFADLDEIDNQEAVSLMVDLGVLEGLDGPNGTTIFQPDATLQRQAMAKIAYMISTGETNWDVYATASPKFTDLGGSWAKGAIEYCNVMGYITGYTATIFGPADTLTVAQTATVLLRVLGYDSEAQGYNGDLWAVKAMRDAKANGLMVGVNEELKAGDPIPRQDACQMAYNALFAKTRTANKITNQVTGQEFFTGYTENNTTLGAETFGLTPKTGILVANEYAHLNGNANAAKGCSVLYPTTVGNDGKTTIDSSNPVTLKLAGATELLGHEVVYYTFGKKMSSSLVATGLTKTDVRTPLNITSFPDAGSSALVRAVNYNVTAEHASKPGDTLVDSNADGVVDYALLTNYTFAEVKDVNTSRGTITISGTFGTRKVADVKGTETLVKGDYVNYAIVGGDVLISKAASVVGTVAVKRGTGATAKLTIGGTDYSVAADTVSNAITADGAIVKKSMTYFNAVNVTTPATEQTFYLDNSGAIALVVGAQAETTSAYGYFDAFKVDIDGWSGKATVQAKVVLADGSIETFTLADDNTDGTDDSSLMEKAVDAKATDTNNSNTAATDALKGLYKYTLVAGSNAMVVKFADKVNTNSTSTSFETGKPTLITGTALVDASTIALYVYTNPVTHATEAKSITGVDNIPNIKAGETVTYVLKPGSAYVSIMVISAEPANTVVAKSYAYSLDTPATAGTIPGGGHQIRVIVNGAETTLTVADASHLDGNPSNNTNNALLANTVYEFETDSKGVSTLTPIAGGNLKGGVVASVTGTYATFADAAGTPVPLSENVTVDDLSAVDAKGNIVPSIGSITVGSNVMYVVDNGVITKVYVMGGTSDTAAIDVETQLYANANTKTEKAEALKTYLAAWGFTSDEAKADLDNCADVVKYIFTYYRPAGTQKVELKAGDTVLDSVDAENGNTYGEKPLGAGNKAFIWDNPQNLTGEKTITIEITLFSGAKTVINCGTITIE